MELFDRANGNVRLTDAGKVYIDAGRKILDLENQMQQKFVDIADHKTGTITVGTTPFRSVTLMPSILAKFKEVYPGIYVVIDEHGTSELKEAGEKGEFDISVITLPVDERKFDYELIMAEEIVLAAPKESKVNSLLIDQTVMREKCRYEAIDFKLLENQEFVMITETQIMQRTLSDLCIDCGIDVKTAAVVKSLEAQIEMVRKGVGIALVPTGVCKEDDDKVCYYSLIQDLPRRQVVAVYRKEQYLSSAAKDLIKVMKLLFLENNAE